MLLEFLKKREESLKLLIALANIFRVVWANETVTFMLTSQHLTICIRQVETVGDKYMTVSGLPEPCIHHARSICHLALDMMEIAGQVQVDGESVQVSK